MSTFELNNDGYDDADESVSERVRSNPNTVGPMSTEELQGVVHGVITDCVTFVDSELSPERAAVTEFYRGAPFGNEEDGRSRVVMTDVRDGVIAILPQILNVFFSSDRALEFIPTRPETTKMARQATDYVQYTFAEANKGFLETHSVLKDGLMKKIGAFKVLWDDSEEQKTFAFENVSEEQLEILEGDEDITIRRITEAAGAPGPMRPGVPSSPYADDEEEDDDAKGGTSSNDAPAGMPSASPAGAGPEGGPSQPIGMAGVSRGAPQAMGSMGLPQGAAPEAPQEFYDVELTLNRKAGRLRVVAMPPEEFIFSREARSIEDAICVAHRSHKTRSELRAMGYSEEQLDMHSGDDVTLRHNLEEVARRQMGGEGMSQDVESGEYNDRVLYTEAFIKVDFDGDGIAELRKVCALGNAYFVVDNKPVPRRPFAMWSPDPEPHTMVGSSWADRLMDIQKWRSNIVRGINDSLSLSLFPRTVVQEGLVNMQDVMNTEIGAPIRTRGPNAVTPLTVPFVGEEAMPILEYIDHIVERRTGQSDGSNGLDADALQSTGKEGVQAMLTASQLQVQLVCRIFAEQCLKPLFKIMLAEMIEHQPRKMMARLRGTWTEVDPRTWDDEMDVQINVGLGKSHTQNKIATLLQVAAEQKDVLNTYGPNNPITRVAQYRETLAELLALNGYPDATPYFDEVPANWQPPAPPAPQPSPEMIQAQAEIQIETLKTKRELAIKEAELQLKRQAQAHDQMIAEKKLAMDFTLQRYQIDAQFKVQYTAAQADADATTTQQWMDAQDQMHSQGLATAAEQHRQTLANQGQAHDQLLAQDQQGFDQGLAQQGADQQAGSDEDASE